MKLLLLIATVATAAIAFVLVRGDHAVWAATGGSAWSWVWLAFVPFVAAAVASRTWTRLRTAAAIAAAFATILAVVALERPRLYAIPARIYDASFGGYYQDAARFESPARIWSDYAAIQPTLLPHSRVHPPGPVTFFWLTTRAAEAAAAGLEALGCFDDEASRDLFAFKLEGNIPGFLLPLLASFWIWPLVATARSLLGAASSGFVESVAIAIPAMVLPVPNVDQVFPLLAALPLLLLERSVAQDRPMAALGAGAAWAFAALFSYAFLPLVPGYVAFVLLRSRPVAGWRRAFGLSMGFVGAAGAMLGAIVLATGWDAASSFQDMLHAHAGKGSVTSYYSYASSLLAAPAAFLLGLGPPLALACLVAFREAVSVRAWREPRLACAVTTAILVVVLAVSGTTRGETMRLWLPILPLAVLAGAGVTWSRWQPGRVEAALITALSLATTVAMQLSGWR